MQCKAMTCEYKDFNIHVDNFEEKLHLFGVLVLLGMTKMCLSLGYTSCNTYIYLYEDNGKTVKRKSTMS